MEFPHSKQITFKYQMDTKSAESPYDIILGSDFFYLSWTITWDGTTIPMKPMGAQEDNTLCEAIYFAQTQSPLLQELEECQGRILDADYSRVDIDALVNDLPISTKSKQQLKVKLKKFHILFGGALGLLNIKKPVTIELQNDAKRYGEILQYSQVHGGAFEDRNHQDV